MPNPYLQAFAPQVMDYQYQMPNANALQQQEAFRNQAMQQMGSLVSQAGQPAQGYTGSSALALANALRKGGDTTQLSDAQKSEISALGSSPTNKLSGYNTGMFGWGNYGE